MNPAVLLNKETQGIMGKRKQLHEYIGKNLLNKG